MNNADALSFLKKTKPLNFEDDFRYGDFLSHKDFKKIARGHSHNIIVAFPPVRLWKTPVVTERYKGRLVV